MLSTSRLILQLTCWPILLQGLTLRNSTCRHSSIGCWCGWKVQTVCQCCATLFDIVYLLLGNVSS